ncbi:hypothetical protein [Paenibacillus sp. Root52]|nr:hypothetical protein [Paenibacillus sp. Root52]
MDAKGCCQLAKQKKSYGAGVFVPGSRNREVGVYREQHPSSQVM